jgi:hypothetical protein
MIGGGAVAVAATGVLHGTAVKPEVTWSPAVGNGEPVSGSSGRPLLSIPDPSGGLPWGMRAFRTTRGQVCAQVGRLLNGQLGELGLDSAFHDDGRFHVLRSGYGASAGQIECVSVGQTEIVEDPNADRSGVHELPEEFRRHRAIPPRNDLRALAYGVLGPHAVSVTYRTREGLRTVPVRGPDGAFLIVEPAGYIKSFSLVGGTLEGKATASSVEVVPPRDGHDPVMVSAAAFRFGSKLCSQGTGSPIRNRCPLHLVRPPRSWLTPTRSLHVPVHLTLLAQTHATCKAASLRDPCYKGEVEFIAPYAITTAAAEYSISTPTKCKIGGRPAGWSLERNAKRNEVVRTDSLGLFVFTPSCASGELFQVSYRNPTGPSAAAPHESVIVGEVSMSRATYPDGAPIAGQGPRTAK